MRKLSCLVASFALLGSAACTADGPLAPELAPEPARMQRSAETPNAARGLALWRAFAETIRADGREPLYVVDGVIWPSGSIGFLDPSSIEHIEVSRADPKVSGCRVATDVVIIATRAQR